MLGKFFARHFRSRGRTTAVHAKIKNMASFNAFARWQPVATENPPAATLVVSCVSDSPGRVCVYRSPQSYFSLQDPEAIPKFYGPVKIKEKAALKIAHQTIKKLGYTDEMVHADTIPKITLPEKMGFNYVPRYRFRWVTSRSKSNDSSVVPAVFDIEVNAENRQIEMLSFAGIESQLPGPKVEVRPQIIKRSEEPELQRGPVEAVWANKQYAVAVLKAILPEISDFITKTGIPLQTPVTTNDIDIANERE